MGRYYALHDGEDAAVADAIRDHYKPLGPSDEVPGAPVSMAVALADKIDSLLGFLMIGQGPTGSGDPYALRRAALGCIRILNGNGLRINNAQILRTHGPRLEAATGVKLTDDAIFEFLGFLADRLKVALRDKGVRHDLIDAVISLGGEDDLVRLVARVEALQAFLKTEDGANLLAGYRRAVNIVKAEEKKDKTTYEGEPDPKLLQAPEEIALFKEMAEARELIAAELQRERFTEAMTVMARLRGPVDAFFDKVTVNAPDARLRENRLLLLSRLRASLHAVADFSKIEG